VVFKVTDLKALEYEDDVKVLYNDWPYGLVDGIVHLVVWSKCNLEVEPVAGDLTTAARNNVNDYVTRVFRDRIGSRHRTHSCSSTGPRPKVCGRGHQG
jgi:hypothetical protein